MLAEENDPSSNKSETSDYSCCNPCIANIDCAYFPCFYDQQTFSFSVDFLYWYAHECNLAFTERVKSRLALSNVVGVVTTATTNALTAERFEQLNTSWDPGVRVGLGWKACENWDLAAYWTYYRNSESTTASVDPFPEFVPFRGEESLQPLWLDGFASGVTPNQWEKIRAKWKFTLNRLDLELGRRYWLTQCFNMRPFIGLSGIWTETNFRVKHFTKISNFLNTPTAPVIATQSATAHLKNTNWSVGLLGGFQPTWRFFNCFSLFGEVDIALLWGKFKAKNSEEVFASSSRPAINTVTTSDFEFSFRNSVFCMQAILDLAIGLRWETYWCDCYHFELDAGWEHHIFFAHNHRTPPLAAVFSTTGPTVNNPSSTTQSAYNQISNDVGMGGLVIRARFEF